MTTEEFPTRVMVRARPEFCAKRAVNVMLDEWHEERGDGRERMLAFLIYLSRELYEHGLEELGEKVATVAGLEND